MRFLVWELYGPLAAWGEVAIGEMRPTEALPGKAALVGLMGAALGIERFDEAGVAALATGYGLGVLMLNEGHFLTDYHTVEVPPEPARKKRPQRTRRDELAALEAHRWKKPGVGTVLSRRDYRTDAYCRVAVWQRSGAPYALEQIRDALREPAYPLYLGRRACPPGLPCVPQVVDAASIRECFDAAPSPFRSMLPQLFADGDRRMAWDVGDEDAPSGVTHARTVERRDQVRSRERWQFDRRAYAEGALTLEGQQDVY